MGGALLSGCVCVCVHVISVACNKPSGDPAMGLRPNGMGVSAGCWHFGLPHMRPCGRRRM